MTIRIAVFVLATSSTVLAQRAVPPTRSHHPDIPYQSPTSLGAASYAKMLCSAVFVSGRDAEEVKQNSAYFLMTEPDRTKPIAADVDRQAKRVRVTVEQQSPDAPRVLRRSRLRDSSGRSRRRPLHAGAGADDAAGCQLRRPWPMGDAPSTEPWPAGLDRAKMQAAVDLAFADPAGLTAAMVVRPQGPDRRRALHGRHHQRHAARKLVDGQEPHRDAGRSGDQGRRVLARRSGAGARLAAARRSARRHSRPRRDAHVERPELHRRRTTAGWIRRGSTTITSSSTRAPSTRSSTRSTRRWSSRPTPSAAIAIPIR